MAQGANDLQKENFFTRWRSSGAAEKANYQLFLSELCDYLHVDRPDPTKQEESENNYVFEKKAEIEHSDGSRTNGYIDLFTQRLREFMNAS